ncbi:MAG TPA: cell envelope integrity protein CreD [Bacteroidetes bacterium]|nr:cell envelope integrity protein CreD [Bacteroidota bacterium]
MKNESQNDIKWYETITFKMVLIGLMAIMFLVPLQLIRMLIQERAENSLAVQGQISREWSKAQTITGPVLNIPVIRSVRSGGNRIAYENTLLHVMPDNLYIKGEINPRIRYKGIYESVIYEADLKLAGSFFLPPYINASDCELLWEEAYFTLGISDNRGIIEGLNLRVNDISVAAQPVGGDYDLFTSGVTFPVFIHAGSEHFDFSADIGLRGSSGIFFTPAGKSTSVSIKSSWTAPSFTGNYLPEKRETGNDGFTATWNISHLNRNFPQSWFGNIHRPEDESFGVNLILEVDHYRKAERAAKYGLLFIAFTYLVLLFLELSANRKIHLFHYFLVSLSLVLFFSLLNALSEQIGFSPAYLISAGSTVGLLTIFSGLLLKKTKYTLLVGGMLTLVYAFIYILLSINEFAYLAGNIGLFIALGTIMWLSAKTDLFRDSGI